MIHSDAAIAHDVSASMTFTCWHRKVINPAVIRNILFTFEACETLAVNVINRVGIVRIGNHFIGIQHG